MKRYIKANVNQAQKRAYYDLGRVIEERFARSHINGDLSSVQKKGGSWIISFWFEQARDFSRAREIADNMSEVVCTKSRRADEAGCYYLDCYLYKDA